MPLICFAAIAYAAGLFGGTSALPTTLLHGAAAVASVFGLLAAVQGRHAVAGCLLVFAVATSVGADARPPAANQRRAAGAPAYDEASRVTLAMAAWRRRAGERLDAVFRDEAPLARALLIADTRQLPAELRDTYARSGLVHMLSISGLHVAIIATAILLAFEAARMNRRAARWAAVAVTAVYVAAIGAPPPAIRSAVMLGAFVAAWATQRPVPPWASLALGTLIPMLLDPLVVRDLGFQLSVAGFAALIAGRAWAGRALVKWSGAKRRIAAELAVSVAATLVTAPLVAWHFGQVSAVGPIANIVAAPVVALLQPALFLALLMSFTPLHALTGVVADAATVLLTVLNGIAETFAQLPFASFRLFPSAATAWAAGVVAVGLVGWLSSRRRRGAFAVTAASGMAAMIWWPTLPAGTGVTELHMLDVGQGDAIAIRTPRGRWVVVDAGGSARTFDAGRRIVAPYLRRRGGELAMLVLTHPHDDHIGGAATVIEQLAPREIRDAAFPGPTPAYGASLRMARAMGVRWARVVPGDSTVLDGVVFTFLAPDSAWTASLKDPNLASTVFKVRAGRRRFLLTGDAEREEEDWLASRDPAALSADVLKVAHHGSRTGTTPAFLDLVGPRVALISVGARNRYGHPSAEVLANLESRGASVWRTDRDGTIVLRTDGEGLEVESASGRTSILPMRTRP